MSTKMSGHIGTTAPAREPARDMFLDRISDGYFALDLEWRFVYLTPQSEELFRRPISELIGSSIWELYPDATTSPVYEHYHRAVAGGVALSFEFYWPPHDAWFSARAYPTNDGLSVFVRDVTADRVSRER